jgi:alpha-tubulin suppressor-like RCC1 family protein
MFHSAALDDRWRVIAWGMSTITGNYAMPPDYSYRTETIVPRPLAGAGRATRVAAGGLFTIALGEDGTLWGWYGINDRAAAIGRFSPNASIVAAENKACVVDKPSADGVGLLSCFEIRGDTEPLADFDSTRTLWKQLSLGSAHACGITQDRCLKCWGDNTRGQLGLGHHRVVMIPTQLAGTCNWRRVQASGDFTCASRGDDSLWCWGGNGWGQLGSSSPPAVPIPQRIAGTWR